MITYCEVTVRGENASVLFYINGVRVVVSIDEFPNLPEAQMDAVCKALFVKQLPDRTIWK